MRLKAIKFNHVSGSILNDALNLRRNASLPVITPEWRAEAPDASSSVAYALKETRGHTLTIQASFEPGELTGQSIQIRAVIPPPPPLPQAWVDFLTQMQVFSLQVYPYVSTMHMQWWSSWLAGSDILGTVRAKWVHFSESEESDYESFELEGPTLWSRGVGIHTARWQWQYRRRTEDEWIPLARTRHKVYSVLQAPTAPWTQSGFPDALSLPWTEVLDYACTWAAAATTQDVAAALITRSVYALGSGTIQYGCAVAGITSYAFPEFDCTAFLDRLRGGFGRGPYVNCTDCATIVSTFANAVGCDLSQAQMGMVGRPFRFNPVRAIGQPTLGALCGVQAFNYHEVAWKGACMEGDAIFDACLLLDASFPPHLPFDAVLSLGIPFGRAGRGQYLDLLVAPSERAYCQPQPATRLRRKVY